MSRNAETSVPRLADASVLSDEQIVRTAQNWPPYLILLASLVLAVTLAATAVRQKSVTVDEFAYLPEGLAWLDGGNPRLNDGNPPLFKILTALPVVQDEYNLDRGWWKSPIDFWALGRSFMYGNAFIYQDLFARARLVPIGFLACVCVATFVVARQLYGPYPAAFAASLTALNPTVLAHGSLVTPDIFFTLGVLVFVMALQAFVRYPSRLRAGAVGGALGLACLFKLSGLVLVLPLWLASLILRAEKKRPDESAAYWRTRTHRRYAAPAAIAMWATLNAGYLFEESFSPLRAYELPLSDAVQRGAGWLPVPLPRHFVESGFFQLAEKGYPAYLNGTLNDTGFWQYYIWTFLYKTPPGVLVLALFAMSIRRPVRAEFPLVTIGVGCFVVFSALKFKNVGIRYLLFCYPLMNIWISRVLAAWNAQPRVRRFITATVAAVGLIASVWSETTIWPNHLSYFNVFAGGPTGGPRHLLDSNIDWGQDLLLLKRYMDQQGITEVDLAYFGRVDPAIYGIRYRQLASGDDARGRWVVISVNLLYGRPYFVNGSDYVPPSDAYRVFRDLTPIERLGHTLYVYDRGSASVVP